MLILSWCFGADGNGAMAEEWEKQKAKERKKEQR
jgi:hypothetical protein